MVLRLISVLHSMLVGSYYKVHAHSEVLLLNVHAGLMTLQMWMYIY